MAVADLSANARTVPESAPEPEKAEITPIPVLTAFMIIITETGEVGLISDINAPVVTRREASGDEIYGALHTAAHKLASSSIAGQSAGNVVSAMQHAGKQMQEAQLNAQIQAQMAQGNGVPAGFKRG